MNNITSGELRHISETFQDGPKFTPLPVHILMLRYVKYMARLAANSHWINIRHRNGFCEALIKRDGISLPQIGHIEAVYHVLREEERRELEDVN